jgi:hypothetical protein
VGGISQGKPWAKLSCQFGPQIGNVMILSAWYSKTIPENRGRPNCKALQAPLKKRAVRYLPFLLQPSIQLESRADERHVGKSLREIPQMLAGGAEFLRVEPHMIGIS